MIDFENRPARYRGTIEVFNGNHPLSVKLGRTEPEWFWHAKGRNGQVVATGGEGYKRRATCIHAADRVFASELTGISVGLDLSGPDPILGIVIPWKLVINDRHQEIERVGAVY